jgi:predicted oxidoreductase
MERVAVGPLELSRIIYGMWRLKDDTDTSPAHVQAKVEACLGQGITTLDQADIYGDYGAEAVLGATFRGAPGLRDRVELITKCGIVAPIGKYADRPVKYYDTTPAHIIASVDHSLSAMATDRVDLLLIHRPDPLMDHQATGRVLDDLVVSGKVRAVGASNFRLHDWTLLQSAMATPLCTNQIEISVLAHEAFSNGDIAWMQERGVPPMAWSPLAGGALFGSEFAPVRGVLAEIADAQGVGVDAVAVAWLLAHPARIMPVVGTNTLARVARIAEAATVDMSRIDWFRIYTAALGHEVA